MSLNMPMPSQIIRYFAYEHLPEGLQAISKPLFDLALLYDSSLPNGPEKSAGLRKLLEAKDCFVRAALPPVALPPASVPGPPNPPPGPPMAG